MRDDIKKALHKAIMKAFQQGKVSITKPHALEHAVHNMKIPGNQKLPESHIPAASESVLNKDVHQQALSEMHSQKQLNAEAKLGQRPKQIKMPKMPASSSNLHPPITPAGAGAPSDGFKGGNKIPKMPRPLQKFMVRMSEKREMSKTDGTINAKIGYPFGGGPAASAPLPPSPPPPSVPSASPPGGQTINARIGYPFGKSKDHKKEIDKTLGATGILKSSKNKK